MGGEGSAHQRTLLIALSILCAATRFLARARSLWEWDEALFVLAMRDYDVALHHPHPPGFPLFIAAARVVRVFVGDDFRALQALSLTAGVLVFPAVYLFARALRLPFETAAGAAVLFAFFPNVWFFGGTAFSDVPSIVLVLFAVTLLLRSTARPLDRSNARSLDGSTGLYWLGTLLLAMAIGIRPQNLLIGLVPGILATRKRKAAEIAVAVMIGVALVAAAYGGAAMAGGSFHDWLRAVREHGQYISRFDSWRSEMRPAPWRMLGAFFVKQYQSPALSIAATLLVIVSIAGSIRERSRSMLWNALTFGPFAIVAWLMLDRFSVSRFSIGYQPLFAILLADGVRRIARRSPARTAAVTGLFVAAFAAFSLPAFGPVRRDLAPPVLAARTVRERIDPAVDRLFVGHTMTTFIDLFAPGVPYTRVIDDRALPLGAPPRAWILGEVTGSDPAGIVFRRQAGNLRHITRRRYFEVRLAPLTVRARFLSGWHSPESDGTGELRAMEARSVTLLPPARGITKLALGLDVAPESAARRPRVTVKVNGRVAGSFRVEHGSIEKSFDVDPAPSGAPNTLQISTDRNVVLRLRNLSWGPT